MGGNSKSLDTQEQYSKKKPSVRNSFYQSGWLVPKKYIMLHTIVQCSSQYRVAHVERASLQKAMTLGSKQKVLIRSRGLDAIESGEHGWMERPPRLEMLIFLVTLPTDFHGFPSDRWRLPAAMSHQSGSSVPMVVCGCVCVPFDIKKTHHKWIVVFVCILKMYYNNFNAQHL